MMNEFLKLFKELVREVSGIAMALRDLVEIHKRTTWPGTGTTEKGGD